MGAGRPRRRRMQEGEEISDALYDGMSKPGAICSQDIQVAINNGNRREDVFFTTRVGKAGSSSPYQQIIPQDFVRYYGDSIRENVVLENASGATWVVTVRSGANVLRFCKGWRAFSVENNLLDGDQLILTQVRKLRFKVTVFDSRGKSREAPAINGSAASAPTATGYDCRGKGLAEPPDVPESTSPTARPLQPAARTEFSLSRPTVLDSNMAKVILRHILPPPPASVQVPDPITNASRTEVLAPIPAPTVDTTRDMAPNEEQNEMEVAQGKDYIFLDSDEDEELVLLEVAMTTLPKNEPKNVAETVRMVSEGEHSRVRIHSPSEKEEVSTPEIEEPDTSYTLPESDDNGDDLPSARLRRRDSGWKINGRNYETTRKKICVRRPSWKGERINLTPQQDPSSASTASPITRSKYQRVGESSQRPTSPITRSKHQRLLGESSQRPTGKAQAQAQEDDNDDGEAVRLVREQGRKSFSDVVCKHEQQYIPTSKHKKCALNMAMEFSAKLENYKFVAVMYAAQVYYGFHLPVPTEILEATGTQRAKVVEAWLTNEKRKMYMVNWAWHDFCETPLLNKDGWAKFALDHFLEEGDVCVFELENSTSSSTSVLLFRVHIFRVEEAALHDSYNTPLSSTSPANRSGMNSAPAERELRHKENKRKSPLSGDFRLQRRPSWTKLIKPNTHDHFGGSRGQRRF